MKIQRGTDMVHPILIECISRIQKEVILPYKAPMRIFETGRTHDRHDMLIRKGKTKGVVSGHLYNLKNDPPLYTTAVDYVHYDKRWSWNLRNSTVHAWYVLFGNMVLDVCPELNWHGHNRTAINFNHFSLKSEIIKNNLDKYPCVLL